MFEHYIYSGTKKLRCGYTTGSCAALAAKAATKMLLEKKEVFEESIQTPSGLRVQVDILDTHMSNAQVCCAVQKDAGDDQDATDGMLIYASVCKCSQKGVVIVGGNGIGKVTRPGLNQPIGKAAINEVPRRMIGEEVLAVCKSFGYDGGIEVVISAPVGEEIARKTFNSHLGIVGGISILGTSGIVEPRSITAFKDSIELEFKQHASSGKKQIIITPGNYGKDYVLEAFQVESTPIVSCSNYLGDALDYVARYGFSEVLLVGHIGKMVKLAGSIMDTYSRMADCRAELFCAHAATLGISKEIACALMDAPTADASLSILQKTDIYKDVLQSLACATQQRLERRIAGAYSVGAVVFSNQYGELYRTHGTDAILKKMEVEG